MTDAVRDMSREAEKERRCALREKLIRELRAGFLETNRGFALQAAVNVAAAVEALIAVEVGGVLGILPLGARVRHIHGEAVGTVVASRFVRELGGSQLWYRVDFGAEEPWVAAHLVREEVRP